MGHAGASGYLPESTLQVVYATTRSLPIHSPLSHTQGYDLAAFLQADYAEPDLVLTQDGHFVAMHDLTLEGTTDVASHPEYADRVSTFVVEGESTTGYYAINFTLR